MNTKTHYVDNKKMFAVMVEHKRNVNRCKREDLPLPPLPEYIGSCFLLIAERLSHRPSFINYPFREDLIGDGVENCVTYARNFKPSKSKNPFAYFTQIIYYAFLRRIAKEKKQLYVKHKSIEAYDLGEFAAEMQAEGHSSGHYNPPTDLMNDFVTNYEKSIENKKKKRKKAKETA